MRTTSHARSYRLFAVGVAGATMACSFTPSPDTRNDGGPADDAPALPDAAPPPDSSFDVSACPPSYTLRIPGVDDALYRLLPAAAFVAQHQACVRDLPGSTHLASVSTTMRQVQLAELANLRVTPPTYALVGLVQLDGQTSVTANWYGITGEPFVGMWANPGRQQPEDGDSVENGGENVAVISRQGTGDVSIMQAYAAICECDGRGLDATVAATINGF